MVDQSAYGNTEGRTCIYMPKMSKEISSRRFPHPLREHRDLVQRRLPYAISPRSCGLVHFLVERKKHLHDEAAG